VEGKEVVDAGQDDRPFDEKPLEGLLGGEMSVEARGTGWQ